MKSGKINKRTAGIFSVFALLFLGIMLPSCAKKMTFQNSTVVPSAEGSVKIKKNNNNNYAIDLNTIRLAEPSRLTPPKNMYIVWMNTDQNGTKKVGQLKTSSSMFSKTLKSSLKTTVPYDPTGFFISAEDNANVPSPTGEIVLRTN